MRVWPVKSTIRLDIVHWPAVILSPGSSRARWPVATNFCSWATRKSLLFLYKSYAGHTGFHKFRAWAPFNFSQSTALDKAFLFKPWNENDNCPWIDKFLSFFILKMYEDLMGAGGGEAVSHLKVSDEDSSTSSLGLFPAKMGGACPPLSFPKGNTLGIRLQDVHHLAWQRF